MRPTGMPWSSWVLAALLLSVAGPLVAQITESNGTVRIEAEAFSAQTARAINGATYTWTEIADTPGYSGTGYIEAVPSDGTSTATVATAWQTTSPQVDYSVTFSNPGTYYVWIRGYAGDAASAGVYIGLNGTSPSSARIDLQQFNTWAWGNTAAGSSTPVSFNIPAAGTYTLNLWMRDSGLDIDRILLTRNPNFTPALDANFWRNQSIYQIITDRFFDADSSNNSLLPNYNQADGGQAHGGDFKGIEKKLDYIKALGATAIWISPVVKNANGDYHGYAATDFYSVNPRMGTLTDLQRLVAEAHKRGILVINDVVVNHGSTLVDSGDSGWSAFKYPPSGYSLRYNNYFNQRYVAPFDDASLQSQFGSTNLSNIFHNNGGTANWADATQVELGELSSLDDFKTETTYIREKMKEIWSYWIDAAGFDAYRLDTVKHVEMGFWDFWSPEIRKAAQAADKPNFFQFGEVWDGSDSKCGSYTGTKSGGNYKLQSVLDYPMYYQVGSVFATASGNTGQIESRYGNLNTGNYDASVLNSLVLNLDNHDNPRFLSTGIGGNTARLEVALAFLYTSRGIPSLYYGTEQDFDGGADPWNREDMFDGQFEGGPSVGDNFNMTSPRFRLVAKLNNLRRLYPALRTGTHDMLWVNWNGPGLLAYARRLNGEEAYVVLNTATTSQTIGARPTIHPAGTVLVDVLNPTNTLTVTTGVDGIPSFTMPPTSYRIYMAQAQLRALGPVVSSISPTHDAASISPASTITVTFSQGMNTATVESAFATVPPSTGSFLWASNNTVMTYTPSSNLGGNALHTVRIENTATDTNGTAIYAPFESRFTTGAAASQARPSINSASVSGITDTSATLGSAVTPNGAATTVFFQYGTTTNYGISTSGQAIGTNNSPVNVSAALSGLASGTSYNYRVYATNSVGATYGPNQTFTTTAPLPQVTTTPASYVTATTASINGTVNPNNLPTSIHFEWGDRVDTLTNWIKTPSQDAGSGATNSDNWAELRDLAPDSTYFFRMVGVTGQTEVAGAILSFHTLPVKPTVTTLAATNVSVTNAILPGTVNPNGSATVFFFEYGTNSSTFGSTTSTQGAGEGTSAVALTANISDLAAGQNYFYRSVASNSFGVAYGSAQSFSAGLPPPAAATLAPANLTSTSAQLRGSINPNNSYASSWFEWGTNSTHYTSSSRIIAADTMEGYTSFNLAGGSVGGGTGFGSFSQYSVSGGGTFIASNSVNQTIDDTKSLGAWAGSGAGVSFRRPISATRQYGTMKVSARFNVDNTKDFSGFNLKSTAGKGSSGFGSGELVSFGVSPIAGNNGILVTDADGQRVLDLGAPVTNTVIDFKVDFDARNRCYVVGAKLRTNSSYIKLGGTMKGTGTNVTHLGFANWNTGNNQDLLFDSLQVLGSAALGAGTNPITVSNSATSLSANTLYHYRIAAMNLDGGITYGENASFYTGVDLAVSKTNSGGALVQGGTGTFTINVANVGGSTSSGTVTVTEQPQAGMAITSMTGTGWTVNTNTMTATRSTTIAAGASYPPITVTVAVSSNAPASLANTVTVSGGGDGNSLNNTATAVASVVPGPDLSISKTATGAFQQGQAGAFVVTVSNIGGSASSGEVAVTEQPPAGMTVTSATGSGWIFDSNTLTASRSDSLGGGTNYPPITVAVMVASNAPAALTNLVTISGGGDANAANNVAQSIASITTALAPLDAWRMLHFGTASNDGMAADTYIATSDGIPNLLKYALGLDPTNAADLSDRPELDTFPPLSIKFRRAKAATDVTINVEAADGIANDWTNIWSSATNAFAGGTNEIDEVVVQDPVPADQATAGQRYLRLRVTRP